MKTQEKKRENPITELYFRNKGNIWDGYKLRAHSVPVPANISDKRCADNQGEAGAVTNDWGPQGGPVPSCSWLFCTEKPFKLAPPGSLRSLKGQCLQVVGNLQVSSIDPEQNFKKTASEGGNSEAHKGQELQNIVCVERWMWKRCQWDVASRHVGLHFEEGKSSNDLSSWQQTHSHQQPDLKIKNKLTKQWEQEHNHRHGDHAEGYQWGREEENWGEGTETKKQKG